MVSFRSRILCILLVIVTFCVLLFSTFNMNVSQQYDITVGSVCPEDIYATRDIVDITTTQIRKNSARDSVKDVLAIDSSITTNTIARAKNILSTLFNLREEEKNARLSVFPNMESKIENSTGLPDDVFDSALNLSDEQFNTLSRIVPEILERVMNEGVTDVEEGLSAFNSSLTAQHAASTVEMIAFEIASNTITVNKVLDSEETERQKINAMVNVKDVEYLKNQIIARKGDIITEAQYNMLTELGFIEGEKSIDMSMITRNISILLILVVLCILYYIRIGKDEISASPVATTLICCLLVCIGAVSVYFVSESSIRLFYLSALCIIPALVSLLLSGNMAVVLNIVIAVLIGMQTDDYIFALSVAISGTATGFYFSKVRRRAHLLPATIISAITYALIYGMLSLNDAKSVLDALRIFALTGAGSFFGNILAIGTIPFWEAIFDVITPMKLGELSNPEHKLLKTMLIKAPGTYHHSLTVANMAEAAASACGANSLLARVGAYYHDIGKTEHPLYFKENQMVDDNPHDHLPPEESAKILLQHVALGAQLAEMYHLPSAVKDIILQHHGTTTASYFLYKAREKDPDTDVSIYTYPGPCPKTKEATIIMLADACEAAVRAMREKGNVDVAQVVENIVSTRISEGQLSDSALTFKDLNNVKKSFVTTLEQYFHKRILYPQNKEKE
ncbi:MAG: HD family phosphohydrolase [Clostridia bacterium]